MEDEKGYKDIRIVVTLLGIAIGVLLTIILLWYMLEKDVKVPTITTQKQINEEGDKLEEVIIEGLELMAGEHIKKSYISVDTSSLDRNSAGQKVLEGDVVIDGLTHHDINYPKEGFKDPNFFETQIQIVNRKIVLLDSVSNLRPVGELRVSGIEPPPAMTWRDRLQMQVDYPEHFVGNYKKDMMYGEEISLTTMVFLKVYMNLWDVTKIELSPYDKLDSFDGNNVDYAYSIDLNDDFSYKVGVKVNELGKDRYELDRIYVKVK